MSTVPSIIIEAATIQVVSAGFTTTGPRTITASPILAAGEGVKVQTSLDGSVWQDVYLNGVLQELNDMHTMMTLLGPGYFRLIKSVTASPVMVGYFRSESDQ